MEKVIKNIIEKYDLGSEKAVVLAVSGGPDSVVLLDLFWRFLPKEKIVVAHANHGIRLESRWDENFVERLCQEYQVKFVSARLKLKSTSEAEAREHRYGFLGQVREESGANYILTAHHLNDQAETVLLSLTRGTGPTSVWGMRELEGNILRPFLKLPKKEILDYAKKKHLRFHLDRSNENLKYARNRIRLKVIPELNKINQRFLESVGRTAILGTEMEEAWDKIILDKEKKLGTESTLDIKKLQKEPLFIQKELIKRKILLNVKRKDGITSDNINKVLELLTLQRGKKTELGRLQVIKGVKNLSFGTKNTDGLIKNQKIRPNQVVKFGDFSLKSSHNSGRATKNNILLPDSFGYNLTIRTWRDGDRIQTKAGTKKLQDVFSDAKISASERRSWPVLVSGRKILWVPQLVSSVEAISNADKKVLKIEVKNERK